METEEVELLKVFLKDGGYHSKTTIDVEDRFSLYGFLKILIKKIEDDLLNEMEGQGRY